MSGSTTHQELSPRGLSAEQHASLLSGSMTRAHDGTLDIWRSMESFGWKVELRQLRASEGGLQACLIPSEQGGFVVWVDDRPSPSEAASGEAGGKRGPNSPLVRFRLAHELAHTFFYEAGRPPTRRTPPDAAEEAFCDSFAALLLVEQPADARRAVIAGAGAVTKLARRLRAPASLVVTASEFAERRSA
jgi:hypothetical protein